MPRTKTGQLNPKVLTTPSVAQTSIQIAGSNPTRLGLLVFNPSATVTLWVAPDSTVAAANGSGSMAIQPLQYILFSGDLNWTNSMNAVFESSTGAVTVLELYE